MPVSIILDRLPYPETIKSKIRKEFEEVCRLLHFNVKGHDIFRRWYVDGRLFYHKIVDTKNPRKGITEVRYINSLKIKKVREIKKEKGSPALPDVVTGTEEYYVYQEKSGYGQNGTTTSQGLKIAKDAITYVPSGLIDGNTGKVLSYLHKAIKPVNQLRMIEDALVIYRISSPRKTNFLY